MLIFRPSKIYISSANVDMRKSINGLAYIVEQKFKLSAQSDMMFVFHNLHCDKVKILYWDGNGFCLLYKRLEADKFHFPRHITADKYTVTDRELEWLLHGLRIEEVYRYENFKSRNYSTENRPFNMA